MKTLYIECKMGAAGDMLTAALYELLDEPQKQDFLRQMNTMFGSDVQVCALPNAVNGISGTHMQVRVLGQKRDTIIRCLTIMITTQMLHMYTHTLQKNIPTCIMTNIHIMNTIRTSPFWIRFRNFLFPKLCAPMRPQFTG